MWKYVDKPISEILRYVKYLYSDIRLEICPIIFSDQISLILRLPAKTMAAEVGCVSWVFWAVGGVDLGLDLERGPIFQRRTERAGHFVPFFTSETLSCCRVADFFLFFFFPHAHSTEKKHTE